MSIAGHYLKRHAPGNRLIDARPAEHLRYIVVIPAYNESGLHHSLDSLFKTLTVEEAVEILVVINWPEDAPEEVREFNIHLYREYSARYGNRPDPGIRCHFILAGDLPARYAGAGLARKIGMDEAIRRFEAAGTDDGIILSFDADTICDPDYFTAIRDHFLSHPGTCGCSIRFEHPLHGTGFEPAVYRAVTFYELHIRYYLRGLRSTGHPNVYHTVGSAFAVRADAYCRQGGMNRRKAGEDFYFLQKLFGAGDFSECNSTRVLPSPRPSDRVVFGTGPAIREFLQTGREPLTFHPETFRFIGQFLSRTEKLYKISEAGYTAFSDETDSLMASFLQANRFWEVLTEINSNVSTPESFHKRLLRWFNMFRMLKFLNSCKNEYPPVAVTAAAKAMLEHDGIDAEGKTTTEILEIYREQELKL